MNNRTTDIISVTLLVAVYVLAIYNGTSVFYGILFGFIYVILPIVVELILNKYLPPENKK
jgi:uncharacterized membrane protein